MKKQTKRLLSIVFAVMLFANMGLTSFANTTQSGDYTFDNGYEAEEELDFIDTNDIYVTIENEAETVYYVDVVWEPLEFTYNLNGDWDPTTHTYSDPVSPWEDDTALVTTKNHSNVDVNVAVSVDTAANEVADITASVTSGNSGTLETADVEDRYAAPDNADKLDSSITVSGKPKTGTEGTYKVGTVTVTISAVTVTP